ncbi:MAG: hypothetical protein J0I69_13780 [Altererythrobacter sp.]|nr:hypothetical protein [Altererythrobacter sp.]OJU59121.1 MAG: hypothetical protein BGO08_05555 [Altererythrobacter sp. 66-12]
MLAIAISLLFGAVAFAAVTVIHAAVTRGVRRARLIRAELAMQEAPRPVRITVRITPALRSRAPMLLAAA